MSLLPIIALAAGLSTSADTLTDDALVAYAQKPYDKAQTFNHHAVLGIHHGTRVVADFPCSDVCPDDTVRVIHYDVEAGPDCDRIGGRSVQRMVPFSIAVMRKMFCVPAILADKKLD